MIVRVNVVLNRTVVVDSNSGFAVILRVKVSCRYQTLLIDVIGQLGRDSIGRLSVKPLSTTVLFRTTLTPTIIPNLLVKVGTVILCFNNRKAQLY